VVPGVNSGVLEVRARGVGRT